MNSRFRSIASASSSLLFVLSFLAAVALAGPPLICHAFDIGGARSLPWTSENWNLTGTENYDTRNLASDTIAILDSNPVVLVHMETLRRATIFARKNPQAAKELLTRLVARAESTRQSRDSVALAQFDAGYLAEAYKEWLGKDGSNPAMNFDGYALVKKAIQLRGNDPQMEFAAALIAVEGSASDRLEHAQKALAGAKNDPLLARNLSSHFGGPNTMTLTELISQNSATKVARQ
jgi:hypothetical protein